MITMTWGNTVRKLIHVVLEQGLKFGLDVAGAGMMGPAWPIVRPLVEKLLGDLPESISKRYKSSQEALDEAAAALEAHEDEIAAIANALERQGMTQAWVESLLDSVDRLSDDMLAVLQQQQQQGKTLGEILALTRAMADSGGARLVLRGERLDYVGYLHLPATFEHGYDLAPDNHFNAEFAGRHMPRGFLLWNFVLANDGRQSATVSRIVVEVLCEYEVPADAVIGGLAPALTPFQDHVVLRAGAVSYPIFKGKYFHYEPDEADAFRISAAFPSVVPIIQRVRTAIEWTDANGTHVTYSPSLFLASAPAADVEELAAHARIKFGL
jgi:hypothetical protein